MDKSAILQWLDANLGHILLAILVANTTFQKLPMNGQADLVATVWEIVMNTVKGICALPAQKQNDAFAAMIADAVKKELDARLKLPSPLSTPETTEPDKTDG